MKEWVFVSGGTDGENCVKKFAVERGVWCDVDVAPMLKKRVIRYLKRR